MNWAKASLVCGVTALLISWSFLFIPWGIFWPIAGGFVLGTCAVNYFIFENKKIKTPCRITSAGVGLFIAFLAIWSSFSWVRSLELELEESRMIHQGEWEVVGEWIGTKSKRTEVLTLSKGFRVEYWAHSFSGKNGKLQIYAYPAGQMRKDAGYLDDAKPERIRIGERVPDHMIARSNISPSLGRRTRGATYRFDHDSYEQYTNGDIYLVVKSSNCDWMVRLSRIAYTNDSR